MTLSGRRIVITGISTHWGAELARRLERDPAIEYLAGIDTRPPALDLERTDFIEADTRTPVLSRLLPPTRADTVVHCGILWWPEPGKPSAVAHDVNVIGTLQLLAACERTETLERVVVRGSAAIYGCMLRYQPEIGSELRTPLVRYLTLPVVPTQLGFDPRLQLLHADDATGALEAAVRNPVRGPVNVAPSGAISLSRILRLARRPSLPVPHPLFGPALARLGGRLGAGTLYGDAVRLLRFGRGVDNRRLREDVGYHPAFDAEAAVRDFAAKTRGRRIGPTLHPAAALDRLGVAG